MGTTDVVSELEPDFVREFGERLRDAWNRHDAAAIAAMCSEDVSWNDAGLPEPAQGREGVAAFVEATVETFPDFRVEAGHSPPIIVGEGRAVLAPYRMSGTMLGAWRPQGFAATNRAFSVEGIDQWTIRGELICHYTTYYDSLSVARQLGFMPEPGSVGHRVLAKMQRLQAAVLRRMAA